MDTDSVLAEWMADKWHHPMYNEPGGADIDSVWERSASGYSARGYEDICRDMVSYMLDKGYVSPEKSIIDIGCGPGTFAQLLSPICSSVLCTDISQGMLSRVESLNLSNVSTMLCDCRALPAGTVRDVAFSSLCPPMNGPEGLRILEESAKDLCIYVSSSNSCPGLEVDIWRALGCDYSYAGYDTSYPARYLESLGVSSDLRYFSQRNESFEPVSDVIDRYVRKLSTYRVLNERDKDIIRGVVSDRSEDGMVHSDTMFRMGMLVWSPRCSTVRRT